MRYVIELTDGTLLQGEADHIHRDYKKTTISKVEDLLETWTLINNDGIVKVEQFYDK